MTSSSDHRLGAPEVGDELDATLFDRLLAYKARSGAFLILVVPPGHVDEVADAIASRLPVDVVDCAALLAERAEEAGRARGARAEVVRRAFSAEPGSRDDLNLRHLVRFSCLPALERELGDSPRTRLLTRVEALARYAGFGPVERLKDRILERGQPLHGLWLLVDEEDERGRPRAGGQPIPHLGAGERARVPRCWIAARARERAHPSGGTA